jgi:polar amino acid transport system substrate-binding protein
MRHGDFDWVHWIDTCLNVAMHGHQTEMYDAAFRDAAPSRHDGFPAFPSFEALALTIGVVAAQSL